MALPLFRGALSWPLDVTPGLIARQAESLGYLMARLCSPFRQAIPLDWRLDPRLTQRGQAQHPGKETQCDTDELEPQRHLR